MISFGLIWISVSSIHMKDYIGTISIWVLAIISNPFITDRIVIRFGIQKLDYLFALKMLLIFGGVILAYIISILVFNFIGWENSGSEGQNYEAIFKMIMYIVYLFVLFFCKSSDKFSKYVIFGAYYFVCTILSFSTKEINNVFIRILNMIPDGNLDTDTYNLLVNSFLVPIKESILTYIIFDTIIGYKGNYVESEDSTFYENIKECEKEKPTPEIDINDCFDVNVVDNVDGKNRRYQIKVNKR